MVLICNLTKTYKLTRETALESRLLCRIQAFYFIFFLSAINLSGSCEGTSLHGNQG